MGLNIIIRLKEKNSRLQLHPAAARCHLIQPLLPSSSAHSPACGQNVLLLHESREFFSLGTYQHALTDFLPYSDFPSPLWFNQPRRTGQNQRGGRVDFLSSPSCHVIVNKPIKIIQKTESDKRRRKSTWNRYEIVLILMFSEVFYQSIFLAISNSFSSYEVIQIISELQLQTDTEGNRYRTFTQ